MRSWIRELEANKKILLEILAVKILVLSSLFIYRPPTNVHLLSDVETYYWLTLHPQEMFKPPTTPVNKDAPFKPIGWGLFLLLFYSIYLNWAFWGILFSFIFSFFTLFLIYKMTNEKIMWLFFFYPYYTYHSNFPLEASLFCFLITLAFYFIKKKNLLSNLICNISSLFRIEGILFSFYLLTKNFKIKNLFIFLVFSFIALYAYGVYYLMLNYTIVTPVVAYPRIFIPFLLLMLLHYPNFFTKHFLKIMIIWFIFGAFVGYFKFFYGWNALQNTL
jgi:hypothetical protein